jgi:iron(III) transport system substrate-binding protein
MKFKRFGMLVVLASVFALLVAACGSDPTATPVPPTATATVAAGVPTPTADPWVAEWEAMKAAAAEEGELIAFLCCGFGSRIGDFIGEAETALGIDIVNSTGSSRQQWAKVEAEREAGVFSLDIWTGGLNTSNNRLLPGGALGDLKSLLVNPEVLDESLWYDGAHFWGDFDEERFVFVYGGNASLAEITYNTDLLDPAEITSYADLLDPKWKGQIIARDPREAGTSQSTALYYLMMGEEFLERLLIDQEVVITSDARQAAEQLALGKFAMCLFACTQEVQAAREDGLPVMEDFPHGMSEGSRLSAGGNTLMAVENPPHPAAQKLFVNWFLGKEGQAWWQRVDTSHSRRDDIGTEGVTPLSVRQPGATYVEFESDPEFNDKLNASLEAVGRILAGR